MGSRRDDRIAAAQARTDHDLTATAGAEVDTCAFGGLVVLSILGCFAATFLLLPALLSVFGGRAVQKSPPSVMSETSVV